MKIENNCVITNKESFLCNLINKLEASLGMRREETKTAIQTCSSPKLKFRNKRTGEIFKKQS